MGNAESSEDRRSILPIAILILALLSVFYVASLEPVVGLYEHGIISGSTLNYIARAAYFPLAYLEQETDFFETPPGEAYMWYIELFGP